MIAKVIDIRFNIPARSAGGKTYTYNEFITQGLPYKGKEKDPRTHRILDNSPLLPIIKTLKVGDMVEYTTDETQYKNINSVKKAEAAPPTSQDTPKQSSGGGYRQNDEETQLRIARSVALKAAVDLVAAMLARDTYKKSMQPAAIIEEVRAISRNFEGYLSLKDDIESLESTVTGIETAEDLEQPPFDV